MWQKVESIDELQIGDKVRVKCKDETIEEGCIVNVFRHFIVYSDVVNTIGNHGWINDPDSRLTNRYNDVHVSDCEVWCD